MSGRAVINYAGIADADSVNADSSHGISPGTCTVVAPAARLFVDDQPHELVMTYTVEEHNFAENITWEDALVVDYAAYTDQSGHMVSVTIADRRWRWKFGDIAGRYNLRDGFGNLITATEKTPVQLIDILMEAMNEVFYDSSRVPNDARPLVDWEHEVPASALDDLCNTLGVRIVFNYRTDAVEFWPVGEGDLVPTLPPWIKAPSFSLSARLAPDTVDCYSDASRIETRFRLEPVALEKDGEIKKHLEASYLPPDGYFQPDCGNVIDPELQAVARRSIYRTFRIMDPIHGLPDPFIEWPEHSRDVEFEAGQVAIRPIANDDEEEHRVPAEIRGFFHKEEGSLQFVSGTLWEDTPSIDPVRRLVTLSRPCYQFTTNGQPTTAGIVLQCAVKIRKDDTHDLVRLKSSAGIGGAVGGGIHPITKQEVRPRYRHTWNDAPGSDPFDAPTGVENNQAECLSQLQVYADAEAERWKPRPGGQGVFVGLHNITMNGNRDRISWSWSTDQVPQTILACNSEVNPYIPGEEERRKNRATDRWIKRLEARKNGTNQGAFAPGVVLE